VQADVTAKIHFGLLHQIVFGTDDGVDSKYSGEIDRSKATRVPYAINLLSPVSEQDRCPPTHPARES